MSDLNHTIGDGWAGLDGFTDEELAAAAAAGDPEAFDVLVGRLAPVVLRFMRRMVDDPAVAEDLVQETLLAVWKGLPDFGFHSKVRTWALGIAHRKAVDHYRRTHEVPSADETFADLASAQPLPSESVEKSELVDALRAELASLPQTSRAVWWLKEVEGLKMAEIGQALRISNGSVRGHLQRSRSYLSTRLAPWRPGAPDPAPAETLATMSDGDGPPDRDRRSVNGSERRART
ncbi:RNA polymerase sigma factor [Gordonia neofelifaecis]|uniref:Sigma-70 family RNA polymerase sigma factor n=1 Tax=Gordonia neofelifaecis NRRL B-59395 TaxID=644548 RepID=F1YK92_9ACTN|nr:sigma-70 family RNA polymerase sigma factor [Gordonia neofelifaecis]EGD54938.1 sigma-70 family RNA polymerase sigma factor [Gordonia neofelifaecis NRRL B-59395]